MLTNKQLNNLSDNDLLFYFDHYIIDETINLIDLDCSIQAYNNYLDIVMRKFMSEYYIQEHKRKCKSN